MGGGRAIAMNGGVVNQSVDSFLKHAHFVMANDSRSVQFNKFAQAVITVNNAAIQVVQIASCEPTTRKGDHRAKIWRNDRDNHENQVDRFNASAFHAFKHLETLHKTLLLLAFSGFSFLAKFGNHSLQIDFVE